MNRNSPSSKRSKLESPQTQQIPLALPGTSWKPNNLKNHIDTSNLLPSSSSSPTSSHLNSGGNKLGLAGLTNPNDVYSPAEDVRPSASGSGSFPPGPANNNSAQTDFDAMNDAVGIAGVDIAAEEELARTQGTMYRTGTRNYSVHSQQSWMRSPRVKILDFLDKQNLTSMVQHIAASFQLKTLEPAILDVLTQAAEARIHSIIVDSIAAKDHRTASSHLRPPPLYPSSPPKGKQKVREPEAMYDQLLYDQPERILSILARVEGEEERKARLERESAELDSDGHQLGSMLDGSQQSNSKLDLSERNRGAYRSDQANKLGQARKEKKRKREGPGQLARNMSEDARARQSNQTAMRSVGGRSKYSWLSGGVPTGTTTRGAGSSSNAIMASLPAPKFAPQPLSQPEVAHDQTSSTATKTTIGGGGIVNQYSNRTGGVTNSGIGLKKDGRLGGIIPPKHASNQSNQVGLKDCLFALERERGTGAGRGTGSKSLFKSYLIGNLKSSTGTAALSSSSSSNTPTTTNINPSTTTGGGHLNNLYYHNQNLSFVNPSKNNNHTNSYHSSSNYRT